MPKYVILVNWTEEGSRTVTQTAQRAEQVTQMIEQMGRPRGGALLDAGAA